MSRPLVRIATSPEGKCLQGGECKDPANGFHLRPLDLFVEVPRPSTSKNGVVELRCQLRFTKAGDGVRALIEARDLARCVLVTIEGTGSDEGEALAVLAERTRDLYGAVCGIVDTVEEVVRRYYEPEDADDDEGGAE